MPWVANWCHEDVGVTTRTAQERAKIGRHAGLDSGDGVDEGDVNVRTVGADTFTIMQSLIEAAEQ